MFLSLYVYFPGCCTPQDVHPIPKARETFAHLEGCGLRPQSSTQISSEALRAVPQVRSVCARVASTQGWAGVDNKCFTILQSPSCLQTAQEKVLPGLDTCYVDIDRYRPWCSCARSSSTAACKFSFDMIPVFGDQVRCQMLMAQVEGKQEWRESNRIWRIHPAV